MNIKVEDKAGHLGGDAEMQLWRAWRKYRDPVVRDQLIQHHMDFARIMAGKLYAARRTNDVEFDEYRQIASIALIESVDRYDPEVGASFRTYASHRITGAILSGLESLTECARQLAWQRRIEQERLQSLREEGESHPEEALTRLMSIAVGLALGFVLEDAGMYRADEGVYADNAYAETESRQLQQRVLKLITQLPERESLIVRHHYLQHQPFDEIARSMGLTKGRVSQLHQRALMLLRAALQSRTHAVDMTL